MVLPLPGNSTREQNFYDEQVQPVPPGVEWPGPAELPTEGGPITIQDPAPFKIIGGR